MNVFQPSETRTRDCTDPWDLVFVHADGQIGLCCWSLPLGTLEEQSLEEIVQGKSARELRAGLLSGDLAECCLNCPARTWTTLGALERRVDDLLDENRLGEIEELRARVYRLEHDREGYRAYVENLLDEREHLQGHIGNLEGDLAWIRRRRLHTAWNAVKDVLKSPFGRRR